MSLEQKVFEIELFEIAKQQLGMPRSIALGYARSWASSNPQGLTPQQAIDLDIAELGNPTQTKELKRREA